MASCDEIAHGVLDSSAVHEAFAGYDVLDTEGRIDRIKLGPLVFGDEQLKKRLEQATHQSIKEELFAFFDTMVDEGVVFAEVPLLFEARWERLFDAVLFIHADDEVRKLRLVANRGMKPEEADRRIEAQLPQCGKLAKSDYIIFNSNIDLTELESRVVDIVQKVLGKDR